MSKVICVVDGQGGGIGSTLAEYLKEGHGEAVELIALGTNVAINKNIKGEPGYLKFSEGWYELDSDETPDGSSIEEEWAALVDNA